MKRRYANWNTKTDILDRELEVKKLEDTNFIGNISKLKIKSVKKAWLVDEEKRKILDKDFTFIGMYPKDENYCITAMYDEKLNIVQWYFDIAKNTGVENGIPYEDDLYLDVVLLPDGRINILDEDELLEANKLGDITKMDIEMAYKVKDNIIEKYSKNIDKLFKITDMCFKSFNK